MSSSRAVRSSSCGGGCWGGGWSRTNAWIRRRVTVGASRDSPSCDGADACDELFGWDVLEQESARAGVQGVEDVLVEVEGGQHEHARGVRGLHDPPGGLEPVDGRHADVHEDDVGPGATRSVDGLGAILGLADHVEVGLGLEDHPKAGAHERLVVGDQDADAHASTPAPSGSRAWMTYRPRPRRRRAIRRRRGRRARGGREARGRCREPRRRHRSRGESRAAGSERSRMRRGCCGPTRARGRPRRCGRRPDRRPGSGRPARLRSAARR